MSPFLEQGGMYTFIFFDTYAAGSSLLFAVLFEVLAVSWVYGKPGVIIIGTIIQELYTL